MKVKVSKSIWFTSITLVTKELDLCDVSPTGCPIPKGRTSLSITKDIPSFVPAVSGLFRVRKLMIELLQCMYCTDDV